MGWVISSKWSLDGKWKFQTFFLYKALIDKSFNLKFTRISCKKLKFLSANLCTKFLNTHKISQKSHPPTSHIFHNFFKILKKILLTQKKFSTSSERKIFLFEMFVLPKFHFFYKKEQKNRFSPEKKILFFLCLIKKL